MAETKTERILIGGRWQVETFERRDQTSPWVSLGRRYDPTQEKEQTYDLNGNPIRTGSYYHGFNNNLIDFHWNKPRPTVNPLNVTRGPAVYVGGKLVPGAPQVGTYTDQNFNPLTTGIPMNLRKHINKLNRRVPDPSQPAYKDYKEAVDKINQIDSDQFSYKIHLANSQGSRTSNVNHNVLASNSVPNPNWAQNAGWDKLVSIAEQTIIKQSLQVNGMLETAYQEAVRRIASSSSPNKVIELQTLASNHQAAKVSLSNLLRSGQTRMTLARNLARQIGASSTQTSMASLANTMVQNTISSLTSAMGDYATPRRSSTLADGTPRMIDQRQINPNSIGTGKVTLLTDAKGRPISKRVMITPRDRLNLPSTRGPIVNGPMAQGSAGYSAEELNSFGQAFGTPGFQTSQANKTTNLDPLRNTSRIMRSSNPQQQLQDARKAWQTILSSSSTSPGDRAVGQKMIAALDQLEQSWKGKGNSGVAAALPRTKTTLAQDPVAMAHKEHQWILDAERMAAGHSTWDVGSRSQDPKVKESFARTGVGTSGHLNGEDPQVIGRRQEAIDRWLNGTSQVPLEPISPYATRVKNRDLFAAQENAQKNLTLKKYDHGREEAVRGFLYNDPNGQDIAAHFSTVEDAVPHVINVLNYRAKMQAFYQPMEGRAIKGQGGKPGGYEQQLDVIGVHEEPFILGGGTNLTIGKAFEAKSQRSGSYNTNLNRELSRLGLDRSASVGQAVQTMMHVVRQINPTGGESILMEHFPTLTRGLEKIYRQGGSGQGALNQGDTQQEFGTSSYEGGAGDDDFNESDIGSSNFFGQTGLNKNEAEYSSKSRWSFDILRNRKNTIIADRMKQAKITDLFRVMAGITGSAAGPADESRKQHKTYVAKATKYERYLASGTILQENFADFLGSTVGGWDMQGSRHGVSGETIFMTKSRDQVGREVIDGGMRLGLNGLPVKTQLNILEDEGRFNDMEFAHLNREHALNLARLASPPHDNRSTMVQLRKMEQYGDAMTPNGERYGLVTDPQGPFTMNQREVEERAWRMAGRTHEGTFDPTGMWYGRDMPSTTYGSLHPAARGAADAYSMYNSLVSQTKEIFGLGERGGAMSYDAAIEQATNAGDAQAVEMFTKLKETSKGIQITPEGLPMGRGLIEKTGAPITKFLPFNPLFSAFHSDIEHETWNMNQPDSLLLGERTGVKRSMNQRLRGGYGQIAYGKQRLLLKKNIMGVDLANFNNRVTLKGGSVPYTSLLKGSQGYDYSRRLLAHEFGQSDAFGRMDRSELFGRHDITAEQFKEMFASRAGFRLDEYGELINGSKKIIRGKGYKGAFSPKQLTNFLIQGFGPELADWAKQAGMKGDDQVGQIASSLVQSGALHNVFGKHVGPEDFVGLFTKGAESPLYKEGDETEHHVGDRMVSKHDYLMADMFAFGSGGGNGRELTPDWVAQEFDGNALKQLDRQEEVQRLRKEGKDVKHVGRWFTKEEAERIRLLTAYREQVSAIKGQHGLWGPEQEAGVSDPTSPWYNAYKYRSKNEERQQSLRSLTNIAMGLRNWASDMQQTDIRQMSSQYESTPGLLHEGSHPDQDKYDILIAGREHRAAEFIHQPLEEAAPILHEMITGQKSGQWEEIHANAPNGPPSGTFAAYKTSAVLNAAYDAIASQVSVLRPNSQSVIGMHEIQESFAQFRKRTSEEMQNSVENGIQPSGITMTRAMILGETTAQANAAHGGKRGIGVYGLETVEQAQKFEQIMADLSQDYFNSNGGPLGFKGETLKELADLLGWNYDREQFAAYTDKNSQVRGYAPDSKRMPRFFLDHPHNLKDGYIYVRDRLLKDTKDESILYGVGYATHPHIGDDIDPTKLNWDPSAGQDNLRITKDMIETGRYHKVAVRAFTEAELEQQHAAWIDPNTDSAYAQLIKAKADNGQGRSVNLADTRIKSEGFAELARSAAQPSRFKTNMFAYVKDEDIDAEFIKAFEAAYPHAKTTPGYAQGVLASVKRQKPTPEFMRATIRKWRIKKRDSDGKANYWSDPSGTSDPDQQFNANDVRGRMLDELKGLGITDVNVGFKDTIAGLNGQNAQGMYYAGTKNQKARIVLSYPNQNISEDEAFNQRLDTLHHEALHHMAATGMLSSEQIAALSRGTSKIAPQPASVPVPGANYFQQIKGLYENSYAPGADVKKQLDEERAAMLYGLYVKEQMSGSVGRADIFANVPKSTLALLDNIYGGKFVNHQKASEDLLGKLLAPPAQATGRGSGGSLPPQHPPFTGNMSDRFEFHPDPAQTISPMDMMMQQLIQFAHKDSKPLFDTKPGAYKMADPNQFAHIDDDFMQLDGKKWTDSQKQFIGAPITPGGAPLVLTGNPGSGKTDVEVARVLHRMQQPGVTPETAPILTSFANVTLEETESRLNALVKSGKISSDDVKRYMDSGGATTIHKLGMRLLSDRHLGWNNVFGKTAFEMKGEHANLYGQGGDDIRLTHNGEALSADEAYALHGDKMEEVDGKWQIKRGLNFERFEQASGSHQIEMFRDALHEVWHNDLHTSGYDVENTDIWRHARGSLPLNPEMDVRKGNRNGIYDRDRPMAALNAEMEGTDEKLLWKHVQILAESGIHHSILTDFFDPISKNTKMTGDIAGFAKEFSHNKGEMWLASKVLGMMDTRAQRGSIANFKKTEHDDADTPDHGLVRYYMPWDLINKPLQYMQNNTVKDKEGNDTLHPRIKSALKNLYGREVVVSEAQDANLGQLNLLTMLSGGDHKLGVSGDPKQDLYPWRGGTRRWLKMAAEAAKNSGSFVHLAESFRFTGGTANFIDEARRKLVSYDETGTKFQVMPESPLVAAGKLAKDMNSTIAVNVHPYGPEGDMGGKDWEHEVMAQQVRHQMGLGVDKSALDVHQAAAIDLAVQNTGAAAGGAIANDFIVVARSNDDVAQITKKYLARGINARANFASDKISQWEEMDKSFNAFDTDTLHEILANKSSDALQWFAASDEGAKILNLYRGGDQGVGKYRKSDNDEAGVEGLIKDVLKAREYLSLPRASEARAEQPEDDNYVLVGTTHGVKGKQRRFAQIPGAIERNFKTGMARNAIEARENFVNLYTALTRGSQAFLYGFNTSAEPRKGKNIESSIMKQARQFASAWGAEAGRQAMQETVVGPTPEEKRRSEPDWAVQRNLQPGYFLVKPSRTKELFSEHLAKYGKFDAFSDGGTARDGTIIAGEGGQDEMLVTKHGAKMMKGTHILDVDKIGAVEILNQKQIKEAKARGNKIINELMNGMGEATAYRGISYRKKEPRPVSNEMMDLPESGTGTITPFSNTSYGHETAIEMTDYLRQRGKFDAELVGGGADSGKGWMVKTKAAGPNEMELIRAAIGAYGQMPSASIAGQTNADLMQDKKGVNYTHSALAGIPKGQYQPLGGDDKSFGYGATAKHIEEILKPLDGAVEKIKIFQGAVGEATAPLKEMAKAYGRDGQGLIKKVVENLHHTEGYAKDGRTDELMAPNKTLLKKMGIKGKQVEDSFDVHGEGMTYDSTQGKYRYYAPGESRTGGTRQLTGNDLTRWQAQQGYKPPGDSIGRRFYNSAQAAYFETQLYGQVTGGVASATKGFDQNLQDSSQKAMATNAALFQGNMLPANGSGLPMLQASQGVLHNVFKADRYDYEKLGLSEAGFMSQSSQFLGMGGHGFSQETMTGAQAAADAAKATGKDQAKAFADFLTNSPEGKALPGFLKAGAQIGFMGGQMGVDPATMMKATVGFGNAGGVTGGDGQYLKSIAGVLAQGARTSLDNPNDYISAGKYVMGNISSLMTGTDQQGQQYASAAAIGLSDTNPDGTKKTPQQMAAEQAGVGKAAEIATVFSDASQVGIGPNQAGRGYEAMAQTEYNMNASQSWLYAQQTGVVDRKTDQLTGVYTSNPQVYSEAIRRSNADYGIQQMGDQQRSAKLSFEGLKIEAKSIDLQAQSVALDAKKFAETAPIAKQAMIDQNVVQNLGYAQNLRQTQFAVSLQPEESQVFGMQQEQQRNELSRTQRSVAASRAYEDALYGAPGQDRSYNAFAKSSQNALAQSQGGQNVGQYVQAVTQGVGLEAAQTYEGIGYSRTMLTLGQSNLNAGAAYAAQMGHLDKTQAFAEEQFKLSSTQRGSERQIQDESLKEQADLLPVVQDLEKKRFDEQQRQTREALDMTLAQGKTLSDSNAEFAINLKYYDQETQIQKDQYDIQSANLDLQAKVNKENRRQNLELQAHLDDVIPKMENFNKALVDQINGYGANKGRTDILGNDKNTGYQDLTNFISTLLGGHKGDDAGAAARRRAQTTGGDSTLANMYEIFQQDYGTTDGENRALDQKAKEAATGAAARAEASAGAQQEDPNADTAPAAAANKVDTSSNSGDKIRGALKKWDRKTRAGWEQASTDLTNALDVPYIGPIVGQVPAVATWWGLSKGLGWAKNLRKGKAAADAVTKGAKVVAEDMPTVAETGAMTVEEATAAGMTLAPEAAGITEAGAGIVAPGAMSPLLAPAAMAIGGYAAGRGLDWATGKAFGVNTHHAGAYIGTGAGIGAAVGSVVPVIGTGVGAAVGAGIGTAVWAIKNPEQAKKAAQAAYDAAAGMFKSIKSLSWDDVKKYAKDALLIIGGPFTAIYETWKHWDTIKAVMSSGFDKIKDLFGKLSDFAGSAWDEIKSHAKDALLAVGGPFTLIYETWTHWDDIKAAMMQGYDAIKSLFGFIQDQFVNILGTVQTMWDDGASAIEAFAGWFGQRFSSAVKWLDDNVDITGTVSSFVGTLVGFITGLPSKIIAGVGDLSKMGGDLAKTVMNAIIISPLNGLIDAINSLPSFDIMGAKVGIPTIDKVPTMASGGYAAGGLTLVGEAGPELLNLGKGDSVTNAARSMQVLRGFAPSIDLRTGHARSLVDNGSYDPRFTLSPAAAANIAHHSTKHVEVTINIAAGAQIDEHLLNRMKAEVAAEIRKVIED